MLNSNRLLNNAAMSVLQTVTSAIVLFFLYRFLFRNLGPEQLGLWSVVLASTSIARLSDFGLTGSVVKYVAKYFSRNDLNNCSIIIQTAAITIVSSVGCILILLYPLLKIIINSLVPSDSLTIANGILPIAMLSLWINLLGGILQSALDGCQKMSLRNTLMIISNLIYFILAIFLAKAYGIFGLAIAQISQSIVLLFLFWFFLRKIIVLPLFPHIWSKSCFKEMFTYAFNLQVISILSLLFDPISKYLVCRYGGLSGAGYYEMSSQMILKFRSLFIAATQSIVPAVAELHEKAPKEICAFYLTTLRAVSIMSFPYYILVIISLPSISVVWLGSVNNDFILISFLLSCAWGINTLCSPAYFCNLGTGKLSANTIGHILMGCSNLFFGILFGNLIGVMGVAFSSSISLFIGSIYILVLFHKKNNLSLKITIPDNDFPLYIYSFSTLTTVIILTLTIGLSGINLKYLILASASYILGLSLLLWSHPVFLSLRAKYFK